MLATPSDLASYIQSDLDTATATLALEVATGWIKDALGQNVLLVTNDTVVLDGGERTLYLPERPVVSVGAVTAVDRYGIAETPVLDIDYRIRGYRLVRAGYRSTWPEQVTVTYTHGYASGNIPQGIRGVCLAAASRLYQNPEGLRSETVGGVSWTTAGAATDIGPGLTTSEMVSLTGAHGAVLIS
jgi:hypothetical protein